MSKYICMDCKKEVKEPTDEQKQSAIKTSHGLMILCGYCASSRR